jgi:hypothetical protein
MDIKWLAILGLGIFVCFAGAHTAISIWGKPKCEVCCKECRCK